MPCWPREPSERAEQETEEGRDTGGPVLCEIAVSGYRVRLRSTRLLRMVPVAPPLRGRAALSVQGTGTGRYAPMGG